MTNSSTPLPPEILIAARALAGLSQEELCRLAGIGRGTLQQMEAPDGRRNARPRTTAAVLQALATRSVSIAAEDDGGFTLHYKPASPMMEVVQPAKSIEERLAEAEGLISSVRAELAATRKG